MATGISFSNHPFMVEVIVTSASEIVHFYSLRVLGRIIWNYHKTRGVRIHVYQEAEVLELHIAGQNCNTKTESYEDL